MANIDEQLKAIIERLDSTDCSVSEIKEKVEELVDNLDSIKYKEKVEAFLKDYPNRWCFRVVRPSNNYFINTAWIPCITYLDDNDKFQHMVWKDIVRMSNGLEVTLRKYSGDDILIEICGNPSSGTPSRGFNHTFPIYITYNETSHKADVIEDPKQQVIDISAMLTAMGFPLPKKYCTKLKNNKPFNFQYAQPMRRFIVSCNDYMNESCLED